MRRRPGSSGVGARVSCLQPSRASMSATGGAAGPRLYPRAYVRESGTLDVALSGRRRVTIGDSKRAPLFRTFQGPFLAGSTPIFATKGPFSSVFRALQVICTFFLASCEFSGLLHSFLHFSNKIQRNFVNILERKHIFLQAFMNISS